MHTNAHIPHHTTHTHSHTYTYTCIYSQIIYALTSISAWRQSPDKVPSGCLTVLLPTSTKPITSSIEGVYFMYMHLQYQCMHAFTKTCVNAFPGERYMSVLCVYVHETQQRVFFFEPKPQFGVYTRNQFCDTVDCRRGPQ